MRKALVDVSPCNTSLWCSSWETWQCIRWPVFTTHMHRLSQLSHVVGLYMLIWTC